jgi:integrating conjugative element protein (TIGR03761 family)
MLIRFIVVPHTFCGDDGDSDLPERAITAPTGVNMTANSEQHPTGTQRAGNLQSSLNVELHTHYAIRLWEGRRSPAPAEKSTTPDDTESAKKDTRRRPDIISMPQVIRRAGNASRDSGADNPYADAMLLKLEDTLTHSTARVQQYVDTLNHALQGLPPGVTLSSVTSSSPLNISVFSHTPLGYKCVWLLVGFDQLAMKAFQAAHYGLISRNERDNYLDRAGHAVRQVYGVIQPYRSIPVTRDDITGQTARGLEAIKRLGEPDADIMSGKRRSAFSPPLQKRSR